MTDTDRPATVPDVYRIVAENTCDQRAAHFLRDAAKRIERLTADLVAARADAASLDALERIVVRDRILNDPERGCYRICMEVPLDWLSVPTDLRAAIRAALDGEAKPGDD